VRVEEVRRSVKNIGGVEGGGGWKDEERSG